MITKEMAMKVKEKLKKILRGESWLRGIGITKVDEDFAVKVNVNKITVKIRQIVPLVLDGVAIVLDEVGDIIAL